MSKISELPAAAAVTGAEMLPAVQNGQTVRIPLENLGMQTAHPEISVYWLQTNEGDQFGPNTPSVILDLQDGGHGC